jgi:sugar (pentulose or hexulose) kinase
MKLLAIDIGSSSVKAAILTGPGLPKQVTTEAFVTRYDGHRAEVDEKQILRALSRAIGQLGPGVRQIDAIAPTTMAPSWLAMDKSGRAITPIVTHQDRRAIDEAHQIEQIIGDDHHLSITGNRPFPGGISSTTWRWFSRHEKPLMKRADLVGHLSTWLIRRLCGTRVTDPSNAGFMGAFDTKSQTGWSDELIAGLGLKRSLLPQVRDANVIGGHVKSDAAAAFGLSDGVPVLAGCMDGSAAMLATGAKVGQLLNVSGSTDVLALLVDRARPHPSLLTRPLGIGRRWLAVSTIAAAGSAIDWVWQTCFSELSTNAFYARLAKVASRQTPVTFDPHLAGSRVSIDERAGAITNLRLGHTRDDVLASLCQSLSQASAERLQLFKKQYRTLRPDVVMTGGVQAGLSKLLQRDWSAYPPAARGRWRFRSIEQATLRGLWALV